MTERLLRAIERDDADRVQKLIRKYSIDIEEIIDDDEAGAPPFVLAVLHGAHDVAELLLAQGANIEATDRNERTACHMAAQKGDIAMLEWLEWRGADLNACDANGDTPLYVAAVECDDESCAERLIELGAEFDDKRLQIALAGAGTRHIQLLIDAGINVGRLYDRMRGTPLHSVRSDRDVEATLDMLVDVCGVDMSAVDYSGNTCCHIAAQGVSARMLRWLIDAGGL